MDTVRFCQSRMTRKPTGLKEKKKKAAKALLPPTAEDKAFTASLDEIGIRIWPRPQCRDRAHEQAAPHLRDAFVIHRADCRLITPKYPLDRVPCQWILPGTQTDQGNRLEAEKVGITINESTDRATALPLFSSFQGLLPRSSRNLSLRPCSECRCSNRNPVTRQFAEGS